jgi:Methyltransferase FkbM domain
MMIRSTVKGVKILLPKGKQHRKIALGSAKGCIMTVDFQSDLKAYLGIFEYELTPHFKRMLKPGSNCFDIGGSGGYHALLMARTCGARVASFECEHHSADDMRSMFAKNPGLAIEVIETYVGAKDGDGLMTIDRAAHEVFVPDVIKLDIEGAEYSALEGALETIKKHRPGFIIEVHSADIEAGCTALLHEFNYVVKTIDQGWFLKDPYRRGYDRWIAAYPD